MTATATWCRKCGREGSELKSREVYPATNDPQQKPLSSIFQLGTLCAWCGYTWFYTDNEGKPFAK